MPSVNFVSDQGYQVSIRAVDIEKFWPNILPMCCFWWALLEKKTLLKTETNQKVWDKQGLALPAGTKL